MYVNKDSASGSIDIYRSELKMISGIILASGFSKRMKMDKLSLKINGTSIIESVIKAASESLLDEILIIYRDIKIKEIADKYCIRTFFNSNANLGLSEAIKLGVRNANINAQAYLFLVGDQPFLTCDVIDQIIKSYNRRCYSIVVPIYNGKKGNPVLFSSKYKERLLRLEGDTGGREIIATDGRQIYFENIVQSKAGLDIDTYEEYITYS